MPTLSVDSQEPKVLVPWGTIKLGVPGLKTGNDLKEALVLAGVELNDCCDEILDNPAFATEPEEVEVELFKVVADTLDLFSDHDGVILKVAYTQAQSFGLEICTDEVAPQWHLQHKQADPQKDYGVLFSKMFAVEDRNAEASLFVAGYSGGRAKLFGRKTHAIEEIFAGTPLIFMKRRK